MKIAHVKLTLAALAVSLMAAQSQAQTPAAPAPATPPAAAHAPVAPAMPATKSATATHPSSTFLKRFASANTTHDGHLTKSQADAARMTFTVRHFEDIDTGKKGYVTAEEIDGYAKAQRTAHKATKAKVTPKA